MSQPPSGCLGFLFKLLAPDDDRADGKIYPYTKKRYLFSKAEKSFYLVLRQCLPEGYVLFAKVRLADVIEVRKGTEGRQKFFNFISAKHVDYLICDEQWLEPRLAIELDDASHDAKKRADRDAFLDNACEAAGLPVMHVKAARNYDTRTVASDIRTHLGV